MRLLSEAKSPFPSERPTDIIPQADGDSGRVTDEEWAELLRRALLEDFRV